MKISKNFLLLGLFILTVVSALLSCKKDETLEELVGNWVERFDIGGSARTEAVAFSIGNVGYVGTGYDGFERLNDFWAYSAEGDNWVQVADFPGEARTGAVAFTASGKGYVGTGWDYNQLRNDFYVYDPQANSWSLIEAEGGPSPRVAAVAFSINNVGYVGTGYDGSVLLDFFSYNPETNTWSAIANYPTKVREAAAFVLNGKGYVCGGEKNGEHINDFYMFDPVAGSWIAKRKVSNVSDEAYDDKYTIVRKKAVAFTVGDKAYLTTGELGTSLKNDVWEYDAATDLWTSKSIIEGYTRKDAVAFSTENGRGFVGTGLNGSSGYFDDLWEFMPMDPPNEDD